MEKIAAVIVTFNRLPLLKQVIALIRSQSLKPDAIFVINNGSTDETGDWLAQQSDIRVITQENVGGSGGFYRGMKEAYDAGYDWIWLMDDDVFPSSTCLEKLIDSKAPIALPLRIGRSQESFRDLPAKVYNLKDPFRKNPRITIDDVLHIKKFAELPEQTSVEDFAFEGPLISREVVEKAGFPRKEFFIYHDDTEYSLRCIKKHGFNAVLIRDAHLYRQLEDKNEINWKSYYKVRNRAKVHLLHGDNLLVKLKPLYMFMGSFLRDLLTFQIKKDDLKFKFWGLYDAYTNSFTRRF